MRLTREQAIRTLINHALDRTHHRYAGRCPDGLEGVETRDPRCRVCAAIDAARVPVTGEEEWQP